MTADNTPPSVGIISHVEIEQVTGDIILRGTADDGTGSGLDKVQYLVGNDTTWKEVDGTYSWRIEFTEEAAGKITTIDSYANAIHAVDVGAGIWRLPIQIRAIDKIGNSGETTCYFDIDPDGDKPIVEVLYPDSGSTLGGTIRVFGSATDNTRVESVWMMIDVNNDGNFDTTDRDHLSSNGYTVSGTGTPEDPYQFKVDGTASWSMALNKIKEFNPAPEVTEAKPFSFRVRAKDENGLYGNWSEVRTISVDNNAPQIGSANPLKLVQYDSNNNIIAERDYIAGMYIRGEWYLVGSVWDESGIVEIDVSGSANKKLSAGSSEWFIQDGIPSGASYNNYQLRIPVGKPLAETTAGSLSYVISVEDASTPTGTATSTVLINYDNKAPVSADIIHGGQKLDTTNLIEQSNRHFTIESEVTEADSGFERLVFYLVRTGKIFNPMVPQGHANNSTTIDGSVSISSDGVPLYRIETVDRTGGLDTLSHDAIKNNGNIRVGGLVRIAGVDRVIQSVNHTSGVVTFSPGVETTHTTADFVLGLVVNNTTKETGEWAGDSLTGIINDDGDGMIESVERTGGNYYWTASFDSKNIPDGPIELHYVAYDKAGNSVKKSVTSFVSNNRPKIAKVYLGTDLDGNGNFTSNELVLYYNAVNGQEESIVNLASQDFKIKGQFGVFTEIVGGNGTLRYTMETNGSATTPWEGTYQNAAVTGGVSNLTSTLIAGLGNFQTITQDVGSLTDMSDRVKLFSITFWDETQETTQGTNSQWALLNAPARVEVVDIVSPKAVIQPFYWNSSSDNSLYNNSKANGHIELEADLPALFNQLSGLFDKDPKVSGQISIRGTAYDDQRLKELWMNIDDFTFTGAGSNSTEFDTNADGTLENLGKTYYLLATYGGGTWTGTDQWTSNGWKMTVEDVSLTQDGHEVRWQLDLDTRRIAGVAGLDKNIRIIAVDNRGTRMNASSETETNNPSDVRLNNKPSYRVDIVPYITSISTPKRNGGGLKDQNIRSSNGKYSIMRGGDGTFATVNGFNLNPNAVRIVNTATSATNTVGTGSGTNLPRAGAASPYTSFTITNAADISGYLEVFTNGIRALNNVNSNDAKGSYAGTEVESSYNMEPDRYVRKNLKLNDDRYLRFFRMHDTGIKNGYYPDMIMDGNDPVFAYLNFSGGPATAPGTEPGTGAGTYQASNAMPQRAKFNGTTAAEITTEYLIKGLAWDGMAMARDEGGRFHHVSAGNYAGDRMTYVYDRYAELHSSGNGSGTGWVNGTQYQGYVGDFAHYGNNNAISMDSNSHTPGLLVGRYQGLKMQVTGNSRTNGNYATVYMAYYDDNTAGKNILFRNFRVGRHASVSTALYNGGSSSTGDGYLQSTNIGENQDASRLTAVAGASKYFDFGVTSDNRVVIVYYDENDGRLKMSYSSGAVDGSAPTTAISWVNSSVAFPDYVGNYVSMDIDSSNGLHISAYYAADGDLVYLYLPAYNSTSLEQVTVDAAFSVGYWTKIKVLEGSGTITPYIAYYNSTENGQRDTIKLAYTTSGITAGSIPSGVDGSGFTTGNWEYLNVPALTPPQGGSTMFKQVCLDFDTSGTPVLGYLGTNLEFGKWLGE